jgi:hypothetical protein
MRKTLGILALLVGPSVAAAQSAAQVTVPKNVISIQPLNAMFTVLSAEYERKGGAAWTWGVGATNFSPDDDDAGTTVDAEYNSGDVKFRYYPQGNALQGFSFGGSLGFAQVTGQDASTPTPTEASESVGTFGVLLEYQWLLGARKKFAVAVGVGAKKLMLDEDEFSSEVLSAYPTARVSVGFAF